MISSARQFADTMGKKDIKYTHSTLSSGKDVLTIIFKGDNMSSIKVRFSFDTDNEAVAIRCFDIVTVPENKIGLILKVVNELNEEYRFCNFYLDTEDNTVTAQADVVFRKHDVGEICLEMLLRCVNIIDEGYPKLMKAMWA